MYLYKNYSKPFFKQYSKQRPKQQGLGLIELMIASSIGLFLMTGIYQIFTSSKHTSTRLQAEAEMQENARFAFEVITSIVQNAGDFGCKSSMAESTNVLLDSPDATFKPENVIEGWEASGTTYGDTYTTNPDSSVSQINTSHWQASASLTKNSGIKSKQHSDILKVWYTKPHRVKLNAVVADVLSFPALDLEAGNVLVINDCQTLNFAQVCKCEEDDCAGTDTQADISEGSCDKPGNKNINLTGLNIATAELSILEQAIFFVGKRGDTQQGYRNNVPALFVKHLGKEAKPSAKEEILEGVESIQVNYGEDTDGDNSPNYYVSADAVTDWSNVVSLKVSLLLRSFNNNVLRGSQTIDFNGAAITTTTSDRYLRRAFSSTISLRNRNIGY